MPDSAHFDAWVGFFAAVVGAAVAMLTTWFGHWLQHRTERRRMASAFVGEITAIMEISNARGFRAALEAGVKQYEAGIPFAYWRWPVSDDYFRVYRQNVDKIGLFDHPIPENLACFYTYCFAVIENLKSMETMDLSDHQMMIFSMKQDLTLIDRIEKIGNDLKECLRSV